MGCFSKWLPFLIPEVLMEVAVPNISAYTIALEAWRRGLTVTFNQSGTKYTVGSSKKSLKWGFELAINPKKGPFYTFKRANKVCTFDRSMYVSKNSLNAHRICINKGETKIYLANKKVPVPLGRQFSSDASDDEILNFAKTIGYPIVIKPNKGRMGKGVFINIMDENILKEKLILLRQELKYKEIVVEQYVKGEEYRIFVIGNKAFCALKRIAANITGNGHDNIWKLINAKNEARRKNPFLSRGTIEITEEVLNRIGKFGYSLNSVLPKGKRLYLSERPAPLTGGDTVDVTDEISEKAKKVAVAAVSAVPGLHQGGVDLIIESGNDNEGKCYVLEINSKAQIGNHLFPVHGTARDVPGAIIDFYFPESKKHKRQNRNLYFNIKKLLRPIKCGIASAEITLAPAPKGKVTTMLVEISWQRMPDVDFRLWARKRALKLNLNGFAKNLESGRMIIVVSGKRKNVKVFKRACKKDFGKTNVSKSKIEIQKWNKPILAGFQINLSRLRTHFSFCHQAAD